MHPLPPWMLAPTALGPPGVAGGGVPPAGPGGVGCAARPGWPGLLAGAGVLAGGALIAGVGGVVVSGAALIGRYLLRRRQHVFNRLTLALTPAGLLRAGPPPARYPGRSGDGYIGASAWVQRPALIAVAAVAVSALETDTAAKPST